MPRPNRTIAIRPLAAADRDWVVGEVSRHFSGPTIESRGTWFDARTLPGLIAECDAARVGLLVHTPMLADVDCEIVALVSTLERIGAASALLAECARLASSVGCRRLFLTTSNDNLDALRFYQRRGWRIVAVHRDSITRARAAKPAIPLVGYYGIRIADELELEYVRSG